MRVLHAGCGGAELPLMPFGKCDEVRLDIDPQSNADVIANITDMGDIGEFDAAYCSHALEHLYPHQVATALGEFFRVLKPGGYALLFVPDLEGVTPSEDVLYESPAGPITSMDLIYGWRAGIEQMPHMAHHTGFTSATLRSALESVGFAPVTMLRTSCFNLVAIAMKGSPCN